MDNRKVVHIDQYLLDRADKSITGFNEMLDDAYKTMDEQSFVKFCEDMRIEIERLTKLMRELK